MVMDKSKDTDDEVANNKVDSNTRKVSFILKKGRHLHNVKSPKLPNLQHNLNKKADTGGKNDTSNFFGIDLYFKTMYNEFYYMQNKTKQ